MKTCFKILMTICLMGMTNLLYSAGDFCPINTNTQNIGNTATGRWSGVQSVTGTFDLVNVSSIGTVFITSMTCSQGIVSTMGFTGGSSTFTILNVKTSAFISSATVFTTLTATGGVNVTSITFSGSPVVYPNTPRVQRNAGLEIIASSYPTVDIATITATFPPYRHLFISAYASGTSVSSDIIFWLNNDRSASYSLQRITSTIITTSITATAIQPFNMSTTTSRVATISIPNNTAVTSKLGSIDGALNLGNTAYDLPYTAESNFFYSVIASSITSISMGQIPCNGLIRGNNSYITVYGSNP